MRFHLSSGGCLQSTPRISEPIVSLYLTLLTSKLSCFQDTCKAMPCFRGLEHDSIPLSAHTGTEVEKNMTLSGVSHCSPFLFSDPPNPAGSLGRGLWYIVASRQSSEYK